MADWRLITRRALPVARQFGVRVYALVLLLVIGWAGLSAFRYLVRTVFIPTPVPERFVEWQGKISPATLREAPSTSEDDSTSRAPLSHYHRTERLLPSDPANGCTAAGCHEPLPHMDVRKVPAFANFHTTFLTCEMCHGVTDQPAPKAQWLRTRDMSPSDPPASLRLLAYLSTGDAEIRGQPNAAQGRLLELLDATLAASPEQAVLRGLRVALRTSEPASPVWKRTVERLRREVPSHARGDYAAKLTPDAPAHREATKRLSELTPKYLEAPTGGPERGRLHQEIHGALRKVPAACTTCHGGATALDYEQLGYPPQRARHLRTLQLASLMQQIRQGERFYLPKLLGPNGNGNGTGKEVNNER